MGFDHLDDMRRIANTVRGFEALDRTTPTGARRRRIISPAIGVLAFATSDVAPETEHTFDLAETPETKPVVWDAGVETQKAYNLTGRTIRDATLCELYPVRLHGVTAPMWHAVPVTQWAQRVRGVTGATITAGSTGTLNSCLGIDGVAESGTLAGVYMPGVNKDAEGGLTTWAEWSTERGRYEIYQQDCPP